jgi:hypothetical protein
MVGTFSDAELSLLSSDAGRELLAGLAHRFDAAEETGLVDEGAPFLSRVMAATIVDAALVELAQRGSRLLERATEHRHRERALSTDPMSGQLDLGRIALASPEIGLWPVSRTIKSRDTPENAILLATLAMVARWGAANAEAYGAWTGFELFARNARAAGELAQVLRVGLGDLPLAQLASAQLLPLALERISLQQADPGTYGRVLELVQILLVMVDPKRQLAQAPDSKWVTAATLGGLNEAGLQHTAFELWVASRMIAYCEERGFTFEFPHDRGAPLALGSSGADRVEVWWQSSAPLFGLPQSRDHEVQRLDGSWKPIALKPDLVLTFAGRGAERILCVECKNKESKAPIAKDLAQTFGYLSHFRGLPTCALAYRGLADAPRYRRTSTGQTLSAVRVPVVDSDEAGRHLFEQLIAEGAP